MPEEEAIWASAAPTIAPSRAVSLDGTQQQDTGATVKLDQPSLFADPGTIPIPDAGYHGLGVVWEDVTVYGTGGGKSYVEDLPAAMVNMVNIVRFISQISGLQLGPKKPIITGFSGVLPEGQTMLVLGRPDSGCSTLLRVLSNARAPFVGVSGNIWYSSIPSTEAKRFAEGEIVFNSEEDEHQPLLTVSETLQTSLTLKRPRNLDAHIPDMTYECDMTNRLLNAFGMPHTRHTKVGNAFVRGVSGGERKRVSLSEVLAINPAIAAWDNAIRGLDSAVALHFFRILRELSRSTGMNNIISTYQTSQAAYETVDRVVVLYEGRQIYSGPASSAEQYFAHMGYERKPRQTVPDFLTSVTSTTERQVRDGCKGSVPLTPEEFASYFLQSAQYRELQHEIAEYKDMHAVSAHESNFRNAVVASKQWGAGRHSPYRVNFLHQVAVLCRRQLQLTKADPTTFIIRLVSNTLQATFVGAICYKPRNDANGTLAISGAIFFAILYYTIFALGEVPATVMSRSLLIKHKSLGFYHPSAFTIAQMAVDLPIYVLQTLVFSSIFYFLVGLNSGAKYFFTFWFTIFTFYLTLSCMYRAIGSWTTGLSVAIRYGALGLSVVLTTAGFIVPPPEQLGWISWLRRASPGSWAFESLMVNEFRTRTLVCRPSDLIPNGPAYADIAYQACTIIGATPGSSSVPGMDFVGAVYGFTSSHIWRNIGILWAMCSLYVILILVGSSLPVRERPGSSGKTYIRQRRSVKPGIKHVETQNIDSAQVVNEKAISLQTAPVYTFQDITYSVQVNDQEKVLLNSVTSTVKPGRLCALMGASGAGKTTLLDTVSLRKTTGVISGEMMIDGVPIDAFFSRKTGFAAQVDVHEPFSTVRECLQFSALLRQGNRRSREEKLAFAEKVLHLLELEPIADAIIGFPGRGGLNVEERKRVTIGVELAADPEFLLMLDEPTSGLDSQASYEIVRFLKKIAAEGLAVLCTIHQPSGDLFEMFDDVLLLAPGGNTVYTGPTGENASTVTRYFAERGCVCPPEANPAEFILSTVAPVGGSTIDWPQLWRDSAESQEIIEYIQQISSRKELGDLEITSHQKLNNGDYASSYFEQTRELILRNFRAQWRDGPFWLTQLVQTVFFGLFVGFYVFKVDHSRNAMQTVTLAYLVSIQSQPALTMDLSINYLAKLDLWRIRERLGIYSWYALATSLLVVALPMLVFCYTLTFLCFYWTVGMTSTGENGALVWLNYVAVGFNTAAFSLALGAISPNPETVPYLLSGLWNLLTSLSWVLVVYSALPSPFRYFFSWLSPLRYLFGSLETAAVADVPLRCTEADLVRFYTPSGQTCIEYAGSFLSTATGYLAGNTSSTTECFYCASDHGLDYIENLGYSASNKWRDWGIFLVWITSTVGMVYLLTWLCKVRSLYKKK